MALRSGRVGIHPSQVDPITGMLLSSPGGASDLSDLDDVAISSVTNDQILRFNSTSEKWENEDMPVVGGMSAHFVITATTGLIVTAVKGSTTITATETSSGVYECDIPEYGTYTISDGTNTTTEDVDVVKIYEITLGSSVPEGSTVTPTDDIQTWLACAGITDKTYTTLNEVLADSTTLLALISSNNATDYLVRSTTWASGVCANSTAMTDIGANNYCANTLLDDATWCNAICYSTYFESVLNVKVPTMTSNTTPSGECSTDGTPYYGSAYYAFDNDSSTWVGGPNAADYLKLNYHFTSAMKLYRVDLTPYVESGAKVKDFYIKGSNDGINYEEMGSFIKENNGNSQTFLVTPNTEYSYIQLHAHDGCWSSAYTPAVTEVQFYGRQDI